MAALDSGVHSYLVVEQERHGGERSMVADAFIPAQGSLRQAGGTAGVSMDYTVRLYLETKQQENLNP